MSEKTEAKSLTFPGTPINQVTVDGDWGERVNGGADPGKGGRYSGSDGTLGVIVLDAALPLATREILTSPDGFLSASQILELGKSDNPPILRLCVEQGKPNFIQSHYRKLLICELVHDEHMRVRVSIAGGDSKGLPAFSYEAHAFTIDDGKLVHIYLNRSVMRDAQSDTHEKLLESVSTKLRSILSNIQWE
jgi:hypothetical protein